MKVIAFNGSPKLEGNTQIALGLVLAELEKKGIETEIINIGSHRIRGCTACRKCDENRDEKCVISGDDVNLWIQKIKESDGVLLGSPVYFSGMTGAMKSFLERAFFVAKFNNNLFRHKVGTSLVTVRRAGGLPALQQLNVFLSYAEMMIATSNYWAVVFGREPGEVLQDQEGVQTLETLGKNMAYMLQLKDAGKHIAVDN
jgi:multimeric flavodoxin WrbA